MASESPEFSDQHTVPILVNFGLEREYVRQLEAVSSRVRILQAYQPVVAEPWRNTEEDWRQLEGEKLDELVSQAEVIFGWGFPMSWLERAHNLKWLQLASAGADRVLEAGLLIRRPDLLLTTASGVHAVPISEHTIAMILHFSRKFNLAVRSQARRQWERYSAGEAQGQTVCLVGYGPIARRTAALCHALGMKVLVVRASINAQQPGLEAVDRFYPAADLNIALKASDYVVVAAPSTPGTQRMIGKEQFANMKESAILINISRGALVDEPALVEALQSGAIAGAGLDVFAEEPLPEDSPLWEMPNVLITPHVAGSNPNYNERVTTLFCDNLTHYLQNEPLRNLVSHERGY